jgi:hypothetical protein
MTGNCHVRRGVGEKAEIISKPYLSPFIGQKPRAGTRENAPSGGRSRQIAGFDVAFERRNPFFPAGFFVVNAFGRSF